MGPICGLSTKSAEPSQMMYLGYIERQLHQTSKQMTLSKEQFNSLVENYANLIIEGLDNDSMESMIFDLLTREYETYTEEQILGEVEELYGEEMAADLLEESMSVTVAEPSTILPTGG